ncbi:MAG: hypothetical protein ACLP5H_02825 [Desulfomonilaceae bacterium]
MLLSELSPFDPRKFKTTTIVLAALVIVSLIPLRSLAQMDFLPAEIQDVELGISSSQLIDKIKNSGDHSTSPLANATRKKLVWPLANNPYYKQVEFEFTEKDRLYLMRFVLNQELRWNLTSLKKQFFDKYHISWDDPGKFRMKDNDVIMYLPDHGKLHFFEMSDVTTGQKSFELFDRNVSAEDRHTLKAGGGAKQAEQGNSTPLKEGVPGPVENKSPEAQGK